MRVGAGVQFLRHLVRASDAGQLRDRVDTKVPQPWSGEALSNVRNVALGEGNFDLNSAPRYAFEAEDNLESSRFDAARGGLDDRHGGASEGDVAPRLGQRAIEGVEKFVEFPTEEGIHVFRCAAGQSKFVFQVYAIFEQEQRIIIGGPALVGVRRRRPWTREATPSVSRFGR